MTHSSQPDFSIISDLLLRNGCLHSPAELHGDLCGQLCAGRTPDLSAWLLQAMRFIEVETLDSAESKVELADLLEQTEAGLKDPELGFKLLVADDDFSLNERMQTLLEWCEGFLSALADNQRFKAGLLSEELKEALEDLEQIASMTDPLEDDEANEQDFFSVVEYVRMTAMLLFSECQADKPADNSASVLQ